MATQLKRVNSKVYEILKRRFRDMLVAGSFPEVEYSESEDGLFSSKRYNMMAYSTTNAKFSKLVHNKIVEAGYEFGIWQNERNAKFLDTVREIANSVTEEQVNNSEERFRTFFD